jgi:hypothetical protein
VHFLQIWILPDKNGHNPGYEQKHFETEALGGQLRVIASPDGRDGSVTIHQDALLLATKLDGAQQVTHTLAPGRRAWAQVARGTVMLNGSALTAGDGVRIENETRLHFEQGRGAEVLLFDLP